MSTQTAGAPAPILDQPTRILVAGDWREPSSGQWFDTPDPATGAVLAQIADATTGDVDEAVAAARHAMTDPAWTNMPKPALAQLLWKVAELIDANGDELARLETLDNGQPYAVSRGINVPATAEHFRYYAGWVTKIDGVAAVTGNPDVFHYTRREPVGVCALITPWNFPLMIASWKLAPALACGNAVVLKPAEQTSLTAIRLAQLCLEAGFPPGVVNLVTGGPEVGKALVNHRGVDKVSFTGSTEVGREIVRASAEDLKRVTLELGGKTPMIIAKDADIDAAVTGAVQGALFNSGQVCAAYARFYVDAARKDEFVDKAAAMASSIKLGAGMEESTQMGPLITEEHLQRVDAFVQGAVSEGAQLVTGGKRADGDLANGYFYRPTVFADVKDTTTIAREEIFGPVIPVLSYDDPGEIVDRANNSNYGLAASVWTKDLNTAHRLAAEIRAGAIFVNMLHTPDARAPWGGFKASGFGREMGEYALDAYTEPKGVFLNLAE